MAMADIARQHGAGRFAIEDEIIFDVGFKILVDHGQHVSSKQIWLEFHHNQSLSESEMALLNSILELDDRQPRVKSRLISTIS